MSSVDADYRKQVVMSCWCGCLQWVAGCQPDWSAVWANT